MSSIKNIRISLGRFFYKREKAQIRRNVKIINLKSVKSAAIIFEANDENNLKHVKELIKHLPANSDISVLGYIDGKKENFSYIGDKVFDYITEEDFDFFMRPKQGIITNFIEKQFDVLFVLHNNYLFHVDLLSGLSKAKFKVGQSGVYEKNLDFFIEIKEKNFNYLISQISFYMNDMKTE